MTDIFRGDNAALADGIQALLHLDDAGVLTPHGIGTITRALLSAAAARLDTPPAVPYCAPGGNCSRSKFANDPTLCDRRLEMAAESIPSEAVSGEQAIELLCNELANIARTASPGALHTAIEKRVRTFLATSFAIDITGDAMREAVRRALGYPSLCEVLAPEQATRSASAVECHGLDTPQRVCFYEQDFYVLSNFSSFAIEWRGLPFPTSEHAYHWMKFNTPGDEGHDLRARIRIAPSAHEAFKIAERAKAYRREDWDNVKVGIMRDILRAKADQHEYVRRKLLGTGDRELVENSWRDDFWGWGPNRDGQNVLGKLWMEIRTELRASAPVAIDGGKHD